MTTLHATLAVAWRHFYKWRTQPANLIPTVMFPLVFLVAFAGGLSAVDDIPGFDYKGGYTTFQFAFVMLQTACFGGVATGFSIGADFATGFNKRLLLTVENRVAIVLGYMLSTVVRAIIVGILVTIVALLAGMTVYGSATDMLALFGLAVLVNLSSTLWACGVMMRARNPQFGPAMQVPVFVSLFLTPVYMPRELILGWLHDATPYNPLTYVLQGFRSLLIGSHAEFNYMALAVLGLLMLTAVWGLTGLRSATRAG